MEIEEAILYLTHTSKDDFNLENYQAENRVEAIKTILNAYENLKKKIGD